MLWVDDQIGRYGPWIKKFEEFGTSVDATDSLADGIQKLEQNQYDVVLLDWKMGHESSMHALPVISAKSKNANLYICSSFFYTDELVDQFRKQQTEHHVRLGSIDKTNLPFVDDDDGTAQFLLDLNATDLIDSVVPDQKISAAFDEELLSTRFPTWDEYSELNARGKIEALKQAADTTEKIRQEFEEAGYRYLFFCGSWTEPLIKLKVLQGLPSQDDIVEKARAGGYAPFVFSLGGGVDDCSERNGLHGYPTLRLGLRGSSEEVHFDSGNPYTLLSYEWYVEKGWLSDSFAFERHCAGEMVLYGRHFTLSGAIVTDASGRDVPMSLQGFAATDWADTRLATHCARDCSDWEARKITNERCKYRTGLLGRNLPAAAGIRFSIDYRTGKVFFDMG
jgi:CheY-like chemotaxis protein